MTEEGKFNPILAGSIAFQTRVILTKNRIRAVISHHNAESSYPVFFVKLPLPAKVASFGNFTNPIL
jgi:hypothetical protein